MSQSAVEALLCEVQIKLSELNWMSTVIDRGMPTRFAVVVASSNMTREAAFIVTLMLYLSSSLRFFVASRLCSPPPFMCSLFTSIFTEGLSGSWKDNGSAGPFTPSSNSSSGGYWSWSAPSDQSNPSTPSPPLSADSFKPFRVPSLGGVGPGPAGPEDPSLEEQDGSSLLFDEPIPRKRKVNTVNHIWVNRLKVKPNSALCVENKTYWFK